METKLCDIKFLELFLSAIGEELVFKAEGFHIISINSVNKTGKPRIDKYNVVGTLDSCVRELKDRYTEKCLYRDIIEREAKAKKKKK